MGDHVELDDEQAACLGVQHGWHDGRHGQVIELFMDLTTEVPYMRGYQLGVHQSLCL
jgi:hypothetical protein